MKSLPSIILLFILPILAGCPVTQSQDTPARQIFRTDPATDAKYWLYVPSYYSGDRAWPLVVTLHGTPGFDGASAQIKEWKALAEEAGFLVIAPELKSAQGILPVRAATRMANLQIDERTILACLRAMKRQYRLDDRAVLLTGFSAGGFAMYYTALRNPTQFSAAIARACNSDLEVFESVQLTDQARKLPITVIFGKDDFDTISRQSWAAVRWLREHRFANAKADQTEGGHIRQPLRAWQEWQAYLPAQHREKN